MAINVIDDEQPSTGETVRSAMTQIKAVPEIAAKDIERANLFDISPDAYAEQKDQLQPNAEAIERVPSTLQPQTEQYVRQSASHLSLAGEDIDKMNFFERRANYYKEQVIDIPEMNREINEIISRKMDDPEGKLEEGDEQALQGLRERIASMNASAEAYGIGDKEEFGVNVLSAAGDMIRQYTENKELFFGSIGAGAAIGGGVGAVTPVPGATIVGLTAGATKGAIVGSALVGFIDGYQQTSRSLFNELDTAVDDQGKSLNIPHQRKVNVSQAVGVISGIASGVAGKVFASNNPILKRFVSPKSASKFVTNPAVMARLDVLGGLAKSALAEGGEEALQEFVQIVGGNFAKMDESEESFLNALDNSLNSETLKQVAYSGAVGTVTGGLVQTVASAPGYPGLKKRFEEVDAVTKAKKDVLLAQNNMLELAQDVKEAKMMKVAPDEMTKFQKKVFSSLGIDENVWFQLEDLREFSNTPEKGEAIRNIIDPTGQMTKMSQELNTPLAIPKADLMKVVTEFPEITDYMRITPDGENPLMIRNEAKEFAGRLDEAEAKRTALMESLGMEEATPEQQEQLRADLNATVGDSKYFTSRESYLGQAAIQPIEGVVNAKEAADLSNAQLKARLAIDESLVSVVDARFDRYADAEFRVETNAEIENEINKLQKEYQIIESFGRTKNLSELDLDFTKSHKKKGFSAFAIDPKSLSEAQRAIYFDTTDPNIKKNLKSRKTFVEGGITVEEAAVLNGLESGDQLLKILAETPTKKQIEQRVKNDPLRNATRPEQIADSMNDTKLVARDEAYDNLSNAHLKEADIMAEREYRTLKRGILKIAKRPVNIKELNERARNTISKMKIRDINPKMFETAEKKTHYLSIKQMAEGQIEQARDNKHKAALNVQMIKESRRAQDKVTRYQKFWKKVNDPSVIQELKDANMSATMEEFMSLYKLDGNIKGESEQKHFNKFVKDQTAAGNFVPVVPERLTNTQASYKDLTVEQYQAMTEMGQFILNQARLKNKLLKKNTEIADLQTQEAIAEEIDQLTKSHYNYDVDRADRKNENHLSWTDKMEQSTRTAISTVSSLKSIIADLDEQKLDGYFHRLIGKPIKDARTTKRAEISEIQAHDKKIIEQFYGMDKFKKMFTEYVNVPEFDGIATIGDGKGFIRKVDLLVLQAYMGDPDGKASIENFQNRDGVSLTLEDVQRVLDTHLDEKDAAFTQNFLVDRFKRFEQRSAELHKRTTGIDAEMVKGVPVVHKDKVLPGGYFPIFRQMLQDEMRAAKYLQDFADKTNDIGVQDEGHFFAQMRSAEMTQQGRLKDRTGSKRPLDLTFENVFEATEEAVHDLAFREVGIDTLKILKNPINVKNMKAVIGPKKFGVLLNSVKDTVSKSTERESVLFGDEYRWVNKIIQKAHSLHAIKAIGLNFRSALIQADSLSNLIMRTGPDTTLFLAKAAQKMVRNIVHYDKYVEAAAEINPDIKFEQDNIDNAVVKHSYDFIPADNTFFKNNKKAGQKYGMIREIQKKFIDASFYFVREADKFNKVLGTHALSDKFFSGKVEGYSMEKLNTMSDSEKATALRSYIQQAFDLSLTASATEDRTPLEKNKVASLFVRYWTDRRSRLNTVLAQIDKTKGAVKRKDNAQAAKHILTMTLALGASSAFVAAVRDEEESIINQLGDARNAEDYLDVFGNQLWQTLTAPIDLTLDTIPLVDNIKYQAGLNIRSDYRNVSTPLFGVASDISAGIVILDDALDMAIQGKVKKLNETQRKIVLTNMGYIAGGLPTNAMYKGLEALQGGAMKSGADFMVDKIKDLHENIDKYIDLYKDDKEAQPFIEELKDYKKELPQFDADVKNILPPNAKEDMKTVLSGGKWNKVNSETGAAGIYQFTEARWNQISALNPDLGLTENGRVSKSPEQQEKAMDWEIADNTRGLLAYELPVTTENLLGAHQFGFDTFVAIASSKDDESLSTAIGKDADKPEFKGMKTVGDVKRYLSNQIRKS